MSSTHVLKHSTRSCHYGIPPSRFCKGGWNPPPVRAPGSVGPPPAPVRAERVRSAESGLQPCPVCTFTGYLPDLTGRIPPPGFRAPRFCGDRPPAHVRAERVRSAESGLHTLSGLYFYRILPDDGRSILCRECSSHCHCEKSVLCSTQSNLQLTNLAELRKDIIYEVIENPPGSVGTAPAASRFCKGGTSPVS